LGYVPLRQPRGRVITGPRTAPLPAATPPKGPPGRGFVPPPARPARPTQSRPRARTVTTPAARPPEN